MKAIIKRELESATRYNRTILSEEIKGIKSIEDAIAAANNYIFKRLQIKNAIHVKKFIISIVEKGKEVKTYTYIPTNR